jgi:hypothetical protein
MTTGFWGVMFLSVTTASEETEKPLLPPQPAVSKKGNINKYLMFFIDPPPG